jgi:hypothetical protein
MVRSVTALRRLLLLLIAAGVAGVWLRRRLEPAPPELPGSGPGPLEIEAAGDSPGAEIAASRLEMGPVTDEMNAIPLPLEEELALVDAAEPEAAAADDSEDDSEPVDIVAVVDDLLEPPS